MARKVARHWARAGAFVVCTACNAAQPHGPAAPGASHGAGGASALDPRDPASIISDPTALEWARETASPRWDTGSAPRLPGCPRYESPLSAVARAIAARALQRGAASDFSDVAILLRALGSPHVWPRVWTLEGQALADADILAAWSGWVAGEPSVGERRCGTARSTGPDGREILVAVVVDALADLAPLPLRARTGQWLRLDAALLAGTRGARLLLLGPDGNPRLAPSRVEQGAFHAVFSLDQFGLWRLQVLLDAEGGPRPALEAWVFVDEEPGLDAASRAAPGEGLAPAPGAGIDALRASLSAMIDAGRRMQGFQSLHRDWALDDLAQAHAEAMSTRGRTAHDVGDGSPVERVARAGLTARRVGENVARARSLQRAHRALWDSPSHRGNLLDPGFEAVGIGVAQAEADDVWVCEIFADYGGVVTPPPSAPPPAASRSAAPELVRAPPVAVYGERYPLSPHPTRVE